MKLCLKTLAFCFLLTKLQTERVDCEKLYELNSVKLGDCQRKDNKQIQIQQNKVQSKIVNSVNNILKDFQINNEHGKYYGFGMQIFKQNQLKPQLPENYNKAPNIGFYPWAYPTPTKFHQDLNKNTPDINKQKIIIYPTIKKQFELDPLRRNITQTFQQNKTYISISSIKSQQPITQKQNKQISNVNPIELPPINFPPPSLNFTIIPNLTQVNPTETNLNSFSYTAPLNLSTTHSNQNNNASVVQASTGYLSSQKSNNIFPISQTHITTNSSLINPSLYINNTSIPSQFRFVQTPSQYTPPLLPSLSSIPIGEKINLSGFLNATDLAQLGCDEYGNC